MSRIYVGNLDPRIGKEELADVFEKYGATRDIWVARKPPGFAFVTFEDDRDAEDAVRGERNNKEGWRVEISRGGNRSSRSYRDDDHYRRRSRSPPKYRDRSPPRYRRSPSGGRGGDERRSPSYGR